MAKVRPGIESKETQVTEGVKLSGGENQYAQLFGLLVAKDDKKYFSSLSHSTSFHIFMYVTYFLGGYDRDLLAGVQLLAQISSNLLYSAESLRQQAYSQLLATGNSNSTQTRLSCTTTISAVVA